MPVAGSSLAQAVLGREFTVKGEILSREPLTIEGDVEGIIEAPGHRVTIAPTGNVRADVKAQEIDILGSLEGNVEEVDIIYIRAGAHFLGDVHAGRIVIEDGGFIRGKVELSRPSSAARAG
jgi:cytoskeletal protein CcmA (bactofilin family)